MSLLSWVNSANDSSTHELSSCVYIMLRRLGAIGSLQAFFIYFLFASWKLTWLINNTDVFRAMNRLVLLWFYNFIAVPKKCTRYGQADEMTQVGVGDGVGVAKVMGMRCLR